MEKIERKIKAAIGALPVIAIIALLFIGVYGIATAPRDQLMYGRAIVITPDADKTPLKITEGVGVTNNIKYDFYLDGIKIGSSFSGGLSILDIISGRPFAQSEVSIRLTYSVLPDKTPGRHMLKIVDTTDGRIATQRIIDVGV